jgi:putrescine transport system permease protein
VSAIWTRGARALVLVPPLAWLVALFLVPFGFVLVISFAEGVDGAPPFRFAPGFPWGTLASWRLLVEDDLYLVAFLNSLRIAATATLITALIGYPMALAITRAPRAWRPLLLTLVILPFWTSFLIRVYAWMALLRPTGVINNLLIGAGLIAEPLPLIANQFAVHLGLVYAYLPFMVLPLWAALERIDPALGEAAADLGARPLAAFWRVTFPLSWPGLAAGALLVFIPAAGEFVIPDLLGGPDTPMLGRVIWNEFFQNRDWPAAAAIAAAMVGLLAAPILAFQRLERRA